MDSWEGQDLLRSYSCGSLSYCWCPAPEPPFSYLFSRLPSLLSSTAAPRLLLRLSQLSILSSELYFLPQEAFLLFSHPVQHIFSDRLGTRGCWHFLVTMQLRKHRIQFGWRLLWEPEHHGRDCRAVPSLGQPTLHHVDICYYNGCRGIYSFHRGHTPCGIPILEVCLTNSRKNRRFEPILFHIVVGGSVQSAVRTLSWPAHDGLIVLLGGKMHMSNELCLKLLSVILNNLIYCHDSSSSRTFIHLSSSQSTRCSIVCPRCWWRTLSV